MRSLRSKLVFTLLIYCAGFGTAIYIFGPPPDDVKGGDLSAIRKSMENQEFAQSFNNGVHKAVVVSKDFAVRAGEYIKTKIEEIEEQRDK